MPSLREQLEDRYGLTATTKNVAEVLKCHPSRVRAMCESGELPAALGHEGETSDLVKEVVVHVADR